VPRTLLHRTSLRHAHGKARDKTGESTGLARAFFVRWASNKLEDANMKPRDAMSRLFPEAAKMGFTLHGSDATKSELLTDRANLRRLVKATHEQAAKQQAAGNYDADADKHAAGIVEAAGMLIGEISNKLDTDEAGGAQSGSGDARDLRDITGQRIGVVLDAATMRDERSIAAALGKGRHGTYDAGGFADDRSKGSLTDFFRGVAGGKTTSGINAGLLEGTDSAGGYAVPNWLLPGVLRALVPSSSMLAAGARMVVLDQQGDSFRIAGIDTVPQASWRLEAGLMTDTPPTFRVVSIVPRSLSCLFRVSRELLMDAPDMDQALSIAISQAFGKELDRAGLLGGGTAPEIRGILNTTGVNIYDMGTNGLALTSYAPIIKAARVIADKNAPPPTAIITSNREAETFDLLSDSLGQPLRRPTALDQMQFLATSQIPLTDVHGTASTASSMYLGDFRLATFYMREQLSVQKLTELYANSGEIGFACHARVDMALAYPSAFCVIEGVIP
jgi:HK97 family phage major capsid protein